MIDKLDSMDTALLRTPENYDDKRADALTAERARELLSYDPETGVLRWRLDRGGKARAGTVAGYLNTNGHRQLEVDGVAYLTHRVIWLMAYGRWPATGTDHRNGKRDDNRLLNIREATQGENAQNYAIPITNSSGFLGVSRHKRSGKWHANIKVRRRQHFLGSFDAPEDAHAAYLAAKAKLHLFQPVPRETNKDTRDAA
jgi:hypothetical protein